MKKTLLICMYFLYALTTTAQDKKFELQVVAEGNFGTPNGDIFTVSNMTGTIVNSGPMYQNTNTGASGFDVLQDFQIVNNKAILLSKAAGFRVVIADYPSLNHVQTFTGNGGPQTLVQAGNTKAYVSFSSPNSVKQIDLTTNTITAVNDPNGSISSYSNYMAYAEGFVYVAISSKIVKIDINSNNVVGTIQPGIGAISGLEYDSQNQKLWALGKVSGVSALLKIDVTNNDTLDSPVSLTGVTNAGYLRFAQNKLYFLSGKNVHFYNISSPNIPTTSIYTSTLTGTWDFAYGKAFYVDPQSSDFVIGTASGFVSASGYEIVNGTNYQLISSGNIPGCIGVNEFILKTEDNLSTEAPIAGEFVVYPNPVKDFLTFSSKNQEEYTVNLFSQVGALIRTAESNWGATRIDVQELPTGIYFAHLRARNNPHHVTIKKLIVTH